jgi:hypothetical protein
VWAEPAEKLLIANSSVSLVVEIDTVVSGAPFGN